MAQGYYTLAEAAQILHTTEDDLKMLARKGDVRSFQDRGTWRFRVQEIDELARQRGAGSDPDLVFDDNFNPVSPAAEPKSGRGRKSMRSQGIPEDEPESFDFALDVDEIRGFTNMDAASQSHFADLDPAVEDAGEFDMELDAGDVAGPKTPPPSSDSDVRLVGEGDEDFSVPAESDVKLDTPPPKKKKSSGRDSSKNKLPPADPTAPDSGVRLVPMDSDSDVRIVGDNSSQVELGEQPPMSASDSDIRLDLGDDEAAPAEPGSLTEEIDLDAEHQQWAEQQHDDDSPVLAVEGGEEVVSSPFELEDSDLELPSTGSTYQDDSGSDFDLVPEGEASSPLELGSSDFDLTESGESSSPLEVSSSEFELHLDSTADSDVDLGAQPSPTHLAGPTSGIGIDKPVDSGVSLESDSSSDEFELDLDAPLGDSDPLIPKTSLAGDDPSIPKTALGGDEDPSMPKTALKGDIEPGKTSLKGDVEPGRTSLKGDGEPGSSEFELTLGDSSSDDELSALNVDSSSEFELSLDAGDSSSSDAILAEPSSSEFELTLDSDDSAGEMSVMDDSSSGEFELTLDDDATESGSDSSFDLTIDSAEMAPELGSDSEFEIQLEGGALDSDDEFEISIDDVDYDDDEAGVGAIQVDDDNVSAWDESASEVVALDDSDLENSDFDIGLDESTSQVVTLDEEDDFSDFGAGVGDKPAFDSDISLEEEPAGFDDFSPDLAGVGVLPDEAEEEAGVLVETQAAPWGVLPIVVMLPCVIVLALVGLMSFELLQSLNGYQEPGIVTKTIGSLMGQSFK